MLKIKQYLIASFPGAVRGNSFSRWTFCVPHSTINLEGEFMKKIFFIIFILLLTPAFIADASDSKQNDKLIQAAMNGNLEDVNAALTNGADINAKDTGGTTAILIALEYGHTDVVKDLIERGADVNLADTKTEDALKTASKKGYTEASTFILNKGIEQTKRIRTLNAAAEANLRETSAAEKAYYADNKTYTDSIERLTKGYSLSIRQGVTVKISADQNHYDIIASHVQGDKTYHVAGPDGKIELYSK
jgi:uncharacterized protein